MKNERIVSLKGLLIYILEHWRSIIVAMIIGAVLLSLFGMFKGRTMESAASKFDEEAAMEEILAAEAEADAVPLKEEELTSVRNALINMQNYYEWTDFNSSTPFMWFDASEIYSTSVSCIINPTANEENAAISFACRLLLNGGGAHQYLKDKLGLDIINWERIINLSDNVNNNSYSSASGVFQINIYYNEEETSKNISDCLIEYLKSKLPDLKEQFGEFDLRFVKNGTEKVYASTMATAQRDRELTTQTYYDNAITQIQGFSRKQLDLYVEKLKDFEYDTSDQKELLDRTAAYIDAQREKSRQSALEKAMKEAGITPEEYEKAKEQEGKPVSINYKRYILIGIVLGAFIMICIYGCKYIFGNRTDLYDDNKALYGIADLGQIPNDTVRKRPFRFVDKWIRALKNRTFKRKTDEAATMCAADIAMLTGKEGIEKLAFVTSGKEFSAIDGSDRILESINGGVEGAVILQNILDDPDSMNKLAKMDGAVVVSKSGKTSRNNTCKLVDLLKRQGINVLGGVTVG